MIHEYSDRNGLGIGKTNKSLFEEALESSLVCLNLRYGDVGQPGKEDRLRTTKVAGIGQSCQKKVKELVCYCLQITGVLFGRRLEKETALESTTSPEKTHGGLMGFLAAVFRLAQMYSHQSLIEGKRRSAGLLNPRD